MAKKKAATAPEAGTDPTPPPAPPTTVTRRPDPPGSSSLPSSSSSVGLEYWLAYLFLVHLRLLLCLAGTGYIHPDEYFQSSEPLIGDLLSSPTLRTWEFQPENPCRSMASVRLWNLPLLLVAGLYRWGGAVPTARTLWLTQRLTALVLSLLVDFCWPYLIPRTREDKKDSRRIMQARLLFASSGATLAFLIRPFSNGVETSLLAASLAVVNALRRRAGAAEAGDRQWHLLSAGLGGLFALGLFTRFTFAIFALPAGIFYLHTCWNKPAAGLRIVGLIRLSAGAVSGFLVTAVAHIVYDTFYYRSRLAAISGILPAPTGLVVTPWNALQYNLSTENLSEHGIHPRWLHIVVNAPLILGVPMWISCLTLLYKRMKTFGAPSQTRLEVQLQESSIELLHLATLFLPLVLLSIQPHQEARFLLPLILPSIALLPQIAPKRLALFLSLHLLQAASLALFFGVLHQAGIIPALLRINEEVLHFSGEVRMNAATLQALALQAPGGGGSSDGLWLSGLLNTSAATATAAAVAAAASVGTGTGKGGAMLVVHVWRSFMPPRHLLLPAIASAAGVGAGAGSARLSRVTLIDHGSQNPQELLAGLSKPAKEQREQQQQQQGREEAEEEKVGEEHLLLAPTWALDTLSSLLVLSPNSHTAAARSSHTSLPLQMQTLALLSPHVDTDHLSESWSLFCKHKHKHKYKRRSRDENSGEVRQAEAEAEVEASRFALLLPAWAEALLAPLWQQWAALSAGLGESLALGVVHVRPYAEAEA